MSIKRLLLISLLALLARPLFANAVDIFPFSSQEKRQQASELVQQLRCLQCQNQNLLESNSIVARDLRWQIYQLVEEGYSQQQIIDLMVERFGYYVLYQPPFNYSTLILWLAPFILPLLVLMIFAMKLRNRKHQP